jgi:O-antigen ligase
MKMLKLLFILIFIALPLGEIARIDLGNSIVLKPLDSLVVFTALFYSFYILVNKNNFPDSHIKKTLTVFSLVALFSLLVNSLNLTFSEFTTAFLYWLRFISYATIYFIVLSFDKKFTGKIARLIFAVGFMVLILGLIQFFLYPDLRNLYYLGWDEHNFRLFSTFLDPNFAGSFLTLFLIFLLGVILHLKKNKEAVKTRFLGVVSVLTVVAVFLTYSRSAILMLVISVAAYLVLINKKNLLLLFVGLVIGIIIILSPTFGKENTNLLRTTSSMARLDSYREAFEITINNPLFGIGFNTYRYLGNSSSDSSKEQEYFDHAGAGSDSSLLFVSATTGLVGLTAYLYMWYSIMKRAFYLYKKRGSIYALIVICSGIGLFVNSLFINSLFLPGIMLWTWIMVGLMERE